MRVQANPAALAAYGMTLEDLRTAITSANIDQAKGNFDGPSQAYTIGANDQLFTSRDYRSVIVAYHNGAPVKLGDVAKVVDGAENVKQEMSKPSAFPQLLELFGSGYFAN